jgi:hypothetical protein
LAQFAPPINRRGILEQPINPVILNNFVILHVMRDLSYEKKNFVQKIADQVCPRRRGLLGLYKAGSSERDCSSFDAGCSMFDVQHQLVIPQGAILKDLLG